MFLFAVECKDDATCITESKGNGKNKCDDSSKTCGECHCFQTWECAETQMSLLWHEMWR